MCPVRFSGRSKLAELRPVRELEGREAMKLSDVWPSWPSGRPIRPFYIPKRVIRIRKIPRLLPVGTEPTAKAVASPENSTKLSFVPRLRARTSSGESMG